MNQSTYHPIAKALIEMGYQPDIIPLALSGSENKSLEEILDILFLLPKDPAQLKSLIQDQKQEEHKIEELAIKNMKLQAEKLKLQKEPQKTQVLTQASRDRLKMYFKITLENLQAIRSHNANDYIGQLMTYLEEIKTSFDKLGVTSREFFELLHDHRLSAKVRNKVFDVVNKILTMRSEYKVKLEKLDELLLMVFSMCLVTTKQRDTILESYRELYKKKKYPINPKFIEKLLKVYNEQGGGDYIPLIDNLELLDQKGYGNGEAVDFQNLRPFEEAKVNDKIGESVDVHCIICMKDLKKVVFLPCCHFLTCPTCSKKVMKCPMCTRTIEKRQKIFWS